MDKIRKRRDQKVETVPHRGPVTFAGVTVDAPGVHVLTEETVRPAVWSCRILDGITVDVQVSAYVDRDGEPVVCVGTDAARVRLAEHRNHDGITAHAMRMERERDAARDYARFCERQRDEARRTMLSYSDFGGGW